MEKIEGNNNTRVYFFKIRIADRNVEVECNNGRYFCFCRNYLSKFDEPDIVVNVSEEKRRKLLLELSKKGVFRDSFEEKLEIRGLESDIIYQEIALKMLNFNTFLMHGSVVADAENAYMIIAPSGVGKTTRAKLWIEEYPDFYIINGDKPLIQITETKAIACGTPWSGKEGLNTNAMVPLRAILLLERADNGEKSMIEEVTIGKAFPTLLNQTYFTTDVEVMRKTIQLLKALEGKVKFYKFRSTPSPEAIQLAYETVCPR